MRGERGQSETVGYALILGFTIISVGAIATFGGAALQSTQQGMGAQNAENAMSQFDSRASMVALGPTNSQQVVLGAGQAGTYTVAPDAGWVRIVHRNESDNSTETIHNGSLGAVRYRDGTTEIAYQGGGVWRRDEGSVMLSPPEFHYRESTLTLPIVQIEGTGSVSGDPTAIIRTDRHSKRIYPNATADGPLTNPVQSGTVSVTVKSDYYEAWADYFESRTDGLVTVNDTRETVSIELVAPETRGPFDMPLEGRSLKLQGIHSHQIDDFTLTIFHDQEDQANFNNLDWSLYAESGSQEFEIRVTPVSSTKDGDKARMTIYYSPNGSTYQVWKNEETFTFETEQAANTDWNGDGDYDDKRLVLNLTSTAEAEYGDFKVKSNAGFDADSFTENPTFSGHDNDIEPETYDSGRTEDIGFIVNHYLALMGPTVELTVADAQQDSVSEEISTGYLDYNTTEGFYLAYMHVTENPVNVTMG